MELSEEKVRNRIAEMHEQIREHGYHAAVGYEYHSGKNADVSSMIVQAESKMYKDKAEYYKQHERSARR